MNVIFGEKIKGFASLKLEVGAIPHNIVRRQTGKMYVRWEKII